MLTPLLSRSHLVGVALVTVLVVSLAACGGGYKETAGSTAPKGGGTSATGLNPADMQARVDNSFFPLSSVNETVLEGQEADPDTGKMVQTREEAIVLPKTDMVAGIEVTVVQDKVFENGELKELTLDYYAQNKDGTVYYLGERVDDYEGGKVVGHESQWLAGEGQNQPGVSMPANPKVGDVFDQEKAPGVAEDRSTVLAVDQTITTAAGTLTGCLKVQDFDPLGSQTEIKHYCPGVGFAREEADGGQIDLVSYK